MARRWLRGIEARRPEGVTPARAVDEISLFFELSGWLVSEGLMKR